MDPDDTMPAMCPVCMESCDMSDLRYCDRCGEETCPECLVAGDGLKRLCELCSDLAGEDDDAD